MNAQTTETKPTTETSNRDQTSMNEIEKAQLAKTTVQCFTGLNGSLENFPQLLKRVIEEKVWLGRLHNGRFFKLDSLRELVTKKPLEGWGQDPAKIEAVIKDCPDVLALWEKEMQIGQGHRSDLVNNINEVKTSKGTSKAYTVSRLKRESPELFAQVVAGELSANAAAIKAGFRAVKTHLEQARHLWGKMTVYERGESMRHGWQAMTPDERKAFLMEIKG